MVLPLRSKATDKFAKSVQRDKEAQQRRQREERTIADKIARLRALRLAKATSDKDVADRTAAATPAGKKPKAVAKDMTPAGSTIDTAPSA